LIQVARATQEAVVDAEIDAMSSSSQVEQGLRRVTEEHRVAIVDTSYYGARRAAEVTAELG